MMDEKGGWGHYHKWRRLQKENEELKRLIITFNTGAEQLKELEDKWIDAEEKRKVKAELKKLKINKI